jgi:aminoglycoside 6'-N-acetyltransferase I
MKVTIRRCTEDDIEPWLEMRRVLWPDGSLEEHRAEMMDQLQREGEMAAFLACRGDGSPIGFVEASLRFDYVNGCETSPVAFVEGLYVGLEWRLRSVARQLCQAVEDWGRGLGCAELGSDVLLDNAASHRAHAALGFEETERVVFYRKSLRG